MLVPSGVRADRIRLTTGEDAVGEIVSSDTTRVYIRTVGGELGIDRRRIRKVEIESASVGAVQRGLLELMAGRVREGLELWAQTAASGDAWASATLSAVLVDHGQELSRAVQKTGAMDRPRVIDRLTALAGNRGLSPEARFVCLQALSALDVPTRVSEILSGPSGWEIARAPGSRGFLTQFWRKQVRRNLAGRDYGEALKAIEQLRLVDEGAGQSQRALWALSQAGEARDRGDVLEALRISVEELLPVMPEVGRNRIAGLLEDLPAWVASAQAGPDRFGRARAFVETTLAQAMPVAAHGALEHLIVERGEVLLSEGRTTDTLELLESAPQLRNQERIRDLALRAEYQQRLDALPPGDPMALYRLGEWAAQQERDDWALESFRRCLESESVEPLATMQIKMVRNRQQSRALEESVRLYKSGRLFDALESLDPILKTSQDSEGGASPFLGEGRRMAELIRQELDLELKKRPYQAEVLYQQAERAFFTADYEGAVKNLAELLRTYGDTPAANRGDALLPQVMRAMQLDQIEGRTRPLPDIPDDLRARVSAEDGTRLDEEIRRLLEAIEPPRPGAATPKPNVPELR